MSGVNYLDNIFKFIIFWLKWIFIDLINKVNNINISRGNSIVLFILWGYIEVYFFLKEVLKYCMYFFRLLLILYIFFEKKKILLFIVDKGKFLLIVLVIFFFYRDIE